MRYLEQLNSETERIIEWWLLEAGRRGDWTQEEQMTVIKSIHACGMTFWRMVMRRRK